MSSYKTIENYTTPSTSKTPKSYQHLLKNYDKYTKYTNTKEKFGAFSISAAVRPSRGCASPRTESGWYKGVS